MGETDSPDPVEDGDQRERAAIALPELFTATVARLESDLASIFGCTRVTLEPLRYDDRPFSHVLRAAVRARESGRLLSRVFIKQLKPKSDKSEASMRERVVHEFTITSRVYEALSGLGDIGAIRPLIHYPETLTLVTAEVAGQTLLASLQRQAAAFPARATIENLERLLATTGRWIAALQAMDEQPGTVSLDELRAYVDLRLARLVAEPRASFDRQDRVEVLAHIENLSKAVDPVDLREVLAHADLALGNIIVDGHRIVVLDFAMAHGGTRLHDVTRLHMQLDMLCAKPQFRRAVISRLQQALLGGFDATLTPAHPLFRLLVLLHRVNNLATLSLRPGRFPTSLYNAHVRRLHRRWIARELRSPAGLATRTT